MKKLQVGDLAPQFTLLNQDESTYFTQRFQR